MYADSENAARQALAELKAAMNKEAQRAVHCIEKDLVSLLTFYRFDRELLVDPIESAILQSGLTRSVATGLADYLVAETLVREQLTLGLSVVVDAVNPVQEARDM